MTLTAWMRAEPPPATMPSSMAARVAEMASSMRCFFSLSSTSVCAPTLMTQTPPASLARRSWSFSRSQSESVRSISCLICATRPATSSWSPAPSMIVVLSLVTTTRRAWPRVVETDLVELEADLLGDDLAAGEGGDVLEHGLAAVAEAGRLDRDDVERAAHLVDDQRREGLAVDVLGDDEQRLAGLDDLLQDRQDVGDGRDLALVDEHVGVLDDGLHALGVGDEVRRDVALVELHALGELELGRRGRGLLDGDDAVLADLVERVGDGRADRLVLRGERGDLGDLVLGLDLAGGLRAARSDTASTALSMPRLRPDGEAPAATLRRPSWTMAWASTVAVVVPSPATSLVLVATSLASWAPRFS